MARLEDAHLEKNRIMEAARASTVTAVTEEREERTQWLLVQDVSIAYEQTDVPVLTNMNLELYEGESVLFLGPSGCGKSTLAMLCANVIPRAVEAHVTGTVTWAHALTVPGAIGYVFQDADAQFCMLKVGDEVAFGLENLQIDSSWMTQRILHSLHEANLDVVLADTHTAFSGGMKQKLAIASALAMDAKLLVFDEPTANLDPASSRLVFERMGALHRAKKSMIVIEHKFDLVLPYMDRVVLFDQQGQIYRIGDTWDVIREEWDWLVRVGIVPPWKARLDPFGKHQEEMKRVSTSVQRRVSTVTEQDAVVTLYNASVRYGEQMVWSDLSLCIEKGSFTAIVGPNGAGKSSLLQVMRGLTHVQTGEIRLLGHPIEKWNKKKLAQTVAYCFQNPEYQFIYERVGDELADRLVGDDVPEDVMQLLDQFGLADHAKHSPFALSQGQKRRLSVAAMVKAEHELYLLDEPTFGQDAKTQQAIMDRLVQLHAQGRTIVLTTHDMDLVSRFATDVLVVAEGKVLYHGDSDGLFADRALMQRAHLLDDLEAIVGNADIAFEEGPCVNNHGRDDVRALQKRTFASKLNPAWFLLSTLLVTVFAVFAHTMAQGFAMFVMPVILMMTLAKLSPLKIAQRFFPFVGFYLFYVWSLTAFAAVGPHTPTFHFLWYRLSWIGFYEGIVLALRMLAAVGFGIFFISSIDLTDLIVALSKNFSVQPKFAYGMLSGIRVVPLFQTEWTKLKQARQLRGKEAKWAFINPVTYALPLLSQAIRMSERVAIAMEARGFQGDVAINPKARTYYRDVRVHVWDYLFLIVLFVTAIALLFAV